jgi:hypothetical protein
VRLCGATGSASDSRSEGCVFKSRRGQIFSLGAFFFTLNVTAISIFLKIVNKKIIY